jgi:aminopeptidase N
LTLKEGSVYVKETKATVQVSDISYDKKSEVAKLSLAEEIPGEGSGYLTITFSGAMNQEMAGFYRSAYKSPEGKNDWMYSTQFESCDARRAFPWSVAPRLTKTAIAETSDAALMNRT